MENILMNNVHIEVYSLVVQQYLLFYVARTVVVLLTVFDYYRNQMYFNFLQCGNSS